MAKNVVVILPHRVPRPQDDRMQAKQGMKTRTMILSTMAQTVWVDMEERV